MSHLIQGSNQLLSHHPAQLDFPPEQEIFHSHLPSEQEVRQIICQLSHFHIITMIAEFFAAITVIICELAVRGHFF